MNESANSLRGRESLQDGLVRVVDKLIESLPEQSEKSASDRGDEIHSFRTTIKRLRALLRLIRPATGEPFFRRENDRLRNAARSLSMARDADVARTTLSEMPVSEETEHSAIAAALSGLEQQPAVEPDLNQVVERVRRALGQTQRNLHRLDLTGTEREVIEAGLHEVYRQSRKRMHVAFENGQDEAFHRWRIRVKNLYYELQFLQPVWPQRLGKMVSRLAQLQDKIGLDHDVAVLKALLRKTPDAFGGTEKVEVLLKRLDKKSRELRGAAKPLGRRVLEETPGRFVRKMGQRWSKR